MTKSTEPAIPLKGAKPMSLSAPNGQPAIHPDRYKWVALTNTTLGILMAVNRGRGDDHDRLVDPAA